MAGTQVGRKGGGEMLSSVRSLLLYFPEVGWSLSREKRNERQQLGCSGCQAHSRAMPVSGILMKHIQAAQMPRHLLFHPSLLQTLMDGR